MTKYIVVIGGVLSGVGKGVATASIGKILKEYGFSVTAIKIDPYINCDAGTLRPTEHGEVWVTDDGGEIDQDLGNYERFLGVKLPKKNNITTGQVYRDIIERERRGDYLGKTVQFIPHVPNEIKRRIKEASEGYDFALIEIGGTVGDYENMPFLFAAKSLEIELGRENIQYVLLTYLPVPSHIEEMKTKPTQTAVRQLVQHGILPDFILCRAKNALDNIRKKKIETYANIGKEYVISAPDITNTIYSIPLNFEKEFLGLKILNKFGVVPKKSPDWGRWKELVGRVDTPKHKVKIAMVGKYIDIGDFALKDSYISVNESLIHAGAAHDARVEIEWIDAKEFEKNGDKLDELKNYDGVLVPGGFGGSGIEGKIKAIKFARENKIPFLGLCLGLQCAVIEYARNVCGLEKANSTEFNPETPNPVIDIMPDQLSVKQKGGTMRLGAWTAVLSEGVVKRLYGGKDKVSERHRHRFEVNPEFHEKLNGGDLKFTGTTEDGKLVEFIEMQNHPFFVATQAHPEFTSTLENPNPLFFGFIKASLENGRRP